MARRCLVISLIVWLSASLSAKGTECPRDSAADDSDGTCILQTMRDSDARLRPGPTRRTARPGFVPTTGTATGTQEVVGKHELIVDWIKFYPSTRDAKTKPAVEWEEHFDNCPENRPDPEEWYYEYADPNNKNFEAQTYTNATENAFCQDGQLIIRALCKAGDQCQNVTCAPDWMGDNQGCYSERGDITSASIWSNRGFSFGRVAARIKIGGEKEGSVGKGSWPAFWSLGKDLDEVGWPNCGEIDTMEYSSVQNTNGQNSYFLNNPYSPEKSDYLTTETAVEEYPMDEEGFRVFTLEYDRDEKNHTHLKMWVSTTFEETLNSSTPVNVEYPKPGTPQDMIADFDKTFDGREINVILNLAIGGYLGGQGPYFGGVAPDPADRPTI